MNTRLHSALACLAAALGATTAAHAADHLDTPTVIADPAADIGDLFAWTSADGRRLNLVMDIVGRQFSDQVQYVFHVDSGKRFGSTTASTTILCRFDVANAVECWAGDADELRGDAGRPEGLDGRHKRFRVFAGLRDDPYYNNVRGTRAALNLAADAIQKGKAPKDAAGCFAFDAETSAQVFAQWRQTEGEPAKNFLAGWKTSALVVSVDLGVVNQGGPLLAVWGRTYQQRPAPGRPLLGKPIDRMGRALTGNALLHTIGTADDANAMKEDYNRAAPADWQKFAPEIGRNLALYDSFDGVPGNQWLAVRGDDTPARYQPLARLLADDRLWVDSRVAVCSRYFAVEMAAEGAPADDCGGRTPNYNVNGVFRSLLIRGTPDGVDDGVDHDDKTHSTTVFPFLSATTDGKIAIANLDQLIEQAAGDAGIDELLLLRSKTLADYAALDRVVDLAERDARTADELLRRSRSRAAVHRFADALADVEAAAQAGAAGETVAAQRASILVAVGRADEVIAPLESNVAKHPGFASHSALATAYAAVDRLDEADSLYAAALADLDTTSPFPHAWIWFMRGLMWSEQGDDPRRGEAMYAQAVRALPQFVVANIHLAELEVRRGDAPAAAARLERIATASGEPEALALLGQLHAGSGQRERGEREITEARQRFEALLARHPLAFADHAAEFYLGAGRDPERAWALAQQNLAARATPRARRLAMEAARATGRSL